MSRRWAAGSTRRWRKVRVEVLERDGYTCQLNLTAQQCPKHHQICQVTCTIEATQVHHTQDREVYGDDPELCLAACQPCNNHVGDPGKQLQADPAPIEWSW